MKRYNRFLNILNIIIFIEIIIMNLSVDVAAAFWMIYKTFLGTFIVWCFTNAILNIGISIANLREKNKKDAILQLVLGMFIIANFFINHRIFSLIISLIGLILSITALKINEKDEQKIKNKIFTGMFMFFASIQIIVFIIPIIMNMINLRNLKKALPIIESQITVKTTVEKENDAYVFYLKNGKELSRAKFDDMYIREEDDSNKLFALKLNGNRLEVGVAKEENRVIIINSQGNEIFSLCNMFEDYYNVAVQFLRYIGETHRYGITIN